MAILGHTRPSAGIAGALVLTALVATAFGCTNFEVAEAESADASNLTEEADAGLPPDASPPDASNRVESTMREVKLSIPDQEPDGVTDVAQITAACIIMSVEVDINILHPWRGDIVVNLTSPAGTLVLLKSYVDEDEVDNVVGTYPTTITPAQPLTALAGEEAMGSWSILVADLDQDDLGTFETWGLRVFCQ